MTRTEQIVFQQFVTEGYEVISHGWPDLIVRKDGKIRGIEVKSGRDYVRPHQETCHTFLRSIGIPVEIAYVNHGLKPLIPGPRDSRKQPKQIRQPKPLKQTKILIPPNLTPKEISLAVDRILLRTIPEIAFGPVTIG